MVSGRSLRQREPLRAAGPGRRLAGLVDRSSRSREAPASVAYPYWAAPDLPAAGLHSVVPAADFPLDRACRVLRRAAAAAGLVHLTCRLNAGATGYVPLRRSPAMA